MAKAVERRKGTATEHASFTGNDAEITVNTTNKSVHVHDGATAGGFELARVDLSNTDLTATITELNYVDGVTSAIQTQLNAKANLSGANFTGNVDVTGTVTADGLTVEGATSGLANFYRSSANANFGAITFKDTANTNTNAQIGWNANELRLDGTSTVRQVTGGLTRMLISSNGDVHLYEDTGTTAKFVWDSSAESLGIGTSTPDAPIDVVAPLTNSVYASFSSTDTRPLQLSSFNTASVDAGHDFNATSGNGALSFSTGSTERLRIDSSGRVGIGTSSPSEKLHVNSTSTTNRFRLSSDDNAKYSEWYTDTNGVMILSANANGAGSAGSLRLSVDGSERMRLDSSGSLLINTSTHAPTDTEIVVSSEYNASGTTTGGITLSARQSGSWRNCGIFANGTDLTFTTGDSGLDGAQSSSERMRLDSSGNLLVGTTQVRLTEFGQTSSGINLLGQSGQEGQIQAQTSGTPVLIASRRSSDGDIIQLRKDGSTVGSIGAKSNDLTIGTGNTGFKFVDAYNMIQPVDSSTGSDRDAAISLGFSNQRFKDLYLSGGVKTGGNSTSPTLVEDNGGIMLRYVVSDSLQASEKTRFTFNIGNRRSVLVKIKVAGSYTASNTESNHVAGEYTVRLWSTGTGATSDSSAAQLDFGYVYQLSNYTFTGNTNGTCTIDIANPTGDPNVYLSYVVELVNATSYAGTLASVTTV